MQKVFSIQKVIYYSRYAEGVQEVCVFPLSTQNYLRYAEQIGCAAAL